MKKLYLIVLLGALLLVGCSGGEEAPPPQESSQETPAQEPEPTMSPSDGVPTVAGDTITTESGLKYIVMNVGDGESPNAGDLVAVHYTGWLTNGTKFDSSRDRGDPLRFPIGLGKVIDGWDEGLSDMQVGGRRLLIIPAELGYGDSGTPGGPIPPGANLVFDVELVSVVGPGTP